MSQSQIGENTNSGVFFLIFSWGRDFSSPPKFSDASSTCIVKVSLGEARMHISQVGLLNKKKRLGYRVSPWPEYN